jgi:hypothetical protein
MFIKINYHNFKLISQTFTLHMSINFTEQTKSHAANFTRNDSPTHSHHQHTHVFPQSNIINTKKRLKLSSGKSDKNNFRIEIERKSQHPKMN